MQKLTHSAANSLTRAGLFAAALALFGFAGTSRGFSQEKLPPPAGKANTAQPAPEAPAEKDQGPDLKALLERLNRLEREVVELRIKSGKIPEDKKDQRVITLLDTPYLGSAFFGSPTNLRYLAAKLTLVNLTDKSIVLKRSDVNLASDGQTYPVKEAPPQFQNMQFQTGQQTMQLKAVQMPAEMQISVGGTGSTWVLFPELPPGSHVPPLVIKFKIGDAEKEIDVNAMQRDALGIKVERIGPRGSLGLIRLTGTLNTISVGSLVEELDRLAADRLVRAVIAWEDGSSIAEQPIANWLQNSALSAGRQQQFNEQQFPGLPATLRELHLARIPSPNNGGVQMSYPSNFVPAPTAVAAQRVHKTDVEAVVAALRSAYEVLPRDEVLQAVQSTNRLEKVAALAGGAGRLPVDKLPVILKNADDNDPVVQEAALVALSHFGEPEAVEKLIFYARKNVAPLSGAAVAGLASSRYSAAHSALLELLANESPESKKNIVRILAAYPRPVWSEAIYEFVKDSRAGLNVEALNALVQVGHPKLVEVLATALRGTDETLKQQSFSILASRTDQESEELALEYTLAHLKSNNATSPMLQLLNRIKDKRALPLLMARFTATQNKYELIQTLALIGDEQTAKFLVEKYPNLQSQEKGEVLRLLVKFDPVSFRQLAAQGLQTGDSTIANYAVQGLQEDGGAEAIKIMADAFEKSSASFNLSILSNALANTGSPVARQVLVKGRDSGNNEKRTFSVNALQILRQRSPGYQQYAQGQQFSLQQKYAEALEYYDMAVQLDPSLPEAWAGRGYARLHLDKAAEAGKDFAKAYDLDPYNNLALTGLCLVMIIADGKPEDGIKKLEESRAKFANDPVFTYNAACVYGRAYAHVEKDKNAPDREKRLAQYKQAAFADLKKSIEMGFQDFPLMKKDPDLKSFHDMPDFQELVKPPAAPPAGAAPAPRIKRGEVIRAAGG